MNRLYGGQSMIAPLKRVLVKRPDEAFAGADPVEWHYSAKPNLEIAQKEHDTFVRVIEDFGVEIIYHARLQPEHADAIFVSDPVLMTNKGAIILKMGKNLRMGEEAAMEEKLSKLGIPILDRLGGDACAEGGDLLWLNEKTLAIGVGFRTNIEGLRQLSIILSTLSVSVVPVELPYYQGPDACLHLLSLISLVKDRLAVLYQPLISVVFWQFMKDMGFKFIEVPEKEFTSMAANILTIKPGICIMLQENPVTEQRLENAGCKVITYAGEEICVKAEGGPSCLTLPILRSF
jgi:dimethylargininase